MSKKGIIYILLNPSFIKCVKIGKTQRTSEERAKEVYRQAKTGIPTEFVVAYEEVVSDCDLVERLVHQTLEKFRINNDREFFAISLKEAIRTIQHIISELKKQHKLSFVEQNIEILTPKSWWENLSFVWQQIFRHHLNIKYQPTEIDLSRAIHSVIEHCQDDKLRNKVSILVSNKRFTQQITKWYNSLTHEKILFNSYLPYEPSKREIEQIFKLSKINCANNIAVLDLKPLEKLLELREINATNTSISDLSPLKNLLNMEVIQLNFTKIDNLDDLMGLPKLVKIDCYSTDMHPKDIKRFKGTRPNCKVLDSTFLSI